MDLVEKDTSSGRDIREYRCPQCGFETVEDRGKALWEILSDAREQAEAEQAAKTAGTQPQRSFWSRLRNLLGGS